MHMPVFSSHTCQCLLALTLPLFCIAEPVLAEDKPAPLDKMLWSRSMGQSGLRRFYSTDADLGEVLNRQSSYLLANRLETSTKASTKSNFVDPQVLASSVESYVGQFDSLLPVAGNQEHLWLLRTLVRTAQRLEIDKVQSRNNRYDLGMLYVPDQNSYFGLGLAMENTSATLRYTTGQTDVQAVGPRLDAGFRITPLLALGVRIEQLRFTGDNAVAARGTSVTRPLDYQRNYIQVESILRLSPQQLHWLPAGSQLGASAAVYLLDSRYQPELNSLGQAVTEPFGNHEHLKIMRTGIFYSTTLAGNTKWNPYTELLLDREFDTNMSHPLDDRTGLIWKAGLAWLPAPGKRISLEYQRSQSRHDLRERDNFLVVAIFDF